MKCDQCGGDPLTHLNVAASVARGLGIDLTTVYGWECEKANAVSRALNVLSWTQRGVDIDHCCCCEDHCSRIQSSLTHTPNAAVDAHA